MAVKLSFWNSINGNRLDNNPDNLDVMPRMEHMRLEFDKRKVDNPPCNLCETCGNRTASHKNRYCSYKCYHISFQDYRPSLDQLKSEMETMSWCAIGRRYKVTCNAVRKWARKYGLIK